MTMIFSGSLLAVIGAFLLNFQNSKENKQLHDKVEHGIEVSEKAINHITGGDSWCHLGTQLFVINPNKLIVHFKLIHEGFFPIPEVRVRLSEAIPEKSNDANVKRYSSKIIHQDKITWFGIDSGNPVVFPILKLSPTDSINEIKYDVEIGAPNGDIIQQIVLRKDTNNVWVSATKVYRTVWDEKASEGNQIGVKTGRPILLYEFVPDNFPLAENEIKSIFF